MMGPKVVIIVLNWNGWQHTVRCLSTLFQSTYDNYEVVLIDNGSGPGDLQKIHEWITGGIKADLKVLSDVPVAKPAHVHEYPSLEAGLDASVEGRVRKSLTIIRSEENLGFAKGSNLGIEYALKDKGVKYAALFNNDMEISFDCLARLVLEAEADERAGACQPMILLSSRPGLIDNVGIAMTWSGRAVPLGLNERDRGQYNKTFEVFGTCAGAVLYRREMLEDIGLFDEDFFAYYEDVDLSLRARKAGWRALSVPFAVVHHVHSASLGDNSSVKWVLLIRNSVFYAVKNFPWHKVLVFLFLFYPLFILVCLCRTMITGGAWRLLLSGVKEGLGRIPYFWKKRRRMRALLITNKSPLRVGAVIVTFYPADLFEEGVVSALFQVSCLVVVDNTPGNAAADFLGRLERMGCHVIRNNANHGVARALNQGISWLEGQGCDWVLTLDQDSKVHPGLIKLYSDAITGDLHSQNVGVLNTRYRDVNTGTVGMDLFSGKKIGEWMDVAVLITSGSFFSLNTYRKVGPFRDDFLLDFADHDFCLRARAKGFRNFIHYQPYLNHALGKKQRLKIFFGLIPVTTNNHPPFRCYLIGRNLTVLLKMNSFREMSWSMLLLWYLLCKFLLVLCFEDDKLIKLKRLSSGVWDGIFNIMGKDVLS